MLKVNYGKIQNIYIYIYVYIYICIYIYIKEYETVSNKYLHFKWVGHWADIVCVVSRHFVHVSFQNKMVDVPVFY